MTLPQRERGESKSQNALPAHVPCSLLDQNFLMNKKRERVKGRRDRGRFFGIPLKVIESENYAMLGAWSVKLLIDIGKQYNGFNNGDLNAAWSIFSKQGWHSKGTLYRAIKELIDKGFIELTRQGGKNRCSLYAITWQSIDECGGKLDVRQTRVASNLWKEK